MILYSLLLGFQSNYLADGNCKIWCTDGSFMNPKSLVGSGKTACGYRLDKDTVVGLKGSTYKMSFDKAIQYCTDMNGYLPGGSDIEKLDSVRWTMYSDLVAAEVINECNYLAYGGLPHDLTIWNSWPCYYKDKDMVGDKYVERYVIPFFKIKPGCYIVY